MQSIRTNALADLRRLAEDLRSSKVASSDRTWKEELDQICIWAYNEGAKSSLPEIEKRINDTKSKVGDQITILCFCVPLS